MDAITVFVKVVEAGSLSAAARRLGMPKTTVSARLAWLERRLGVRLIQRTTRQLRVTDAGQKYFQHCAAAIREIELGEAALQSAKTKPTGVLKVTAPVDVGHSVLPRIVSAYSRLYPDVSLELFVTNRAVDLVGEGVDLAIRSSTLLKDSSLISRRFLDAPTNLWASPKYLEALGKPTHPRDLARASFLRSHAEVLFLHRSVILTNGRSDFEVQMTGPLCADDAETRKSLSLLGEGVAWLPGYLVEDAVRAGRLVPVLAHWYPKVRATFHFVFAGRGYALPKVEAFIQTALRLVERPA